MRNQLASHPGLGLPTTLGVFSGWGRRDSPCEGEGEALRRNASHWGIRDKAPTLTEFNNLAENKDTGPEFDYGVIDVVGEAHSLLEAPCK